MAAVVSDGNGGLYIRRTVVEKVLIGVAGSMIAAFFAFMGWIGIETYRVIRAQNDELIRLGVRLEAVAVQGQANTQAILDHDKWARDQRDNLDGRLDKMEKER